MKFLIVLGFLMVAACNIQAEITKDEAMAIATSCKEETGASDADFEAIVTHQAAPNDEGKCMLACVLKKYGVMGDDGKLIKHAALEISESLITSDDERALMTEIIDTCDALDVSDEHCDAAEEYGECWRNEVIAKGISPDHLV